MAYAWYASQAMTQCVYLMWMPECNVRVCVLRSSNAKCALSIKINNSENDSANTEMKYQQTFNAVGEGGCYEELDEQVHDE